MQIQVRRVENRGLMQVREFQSFRIDTRTQYVFNYTSHYMIYGERTLHILIKATPYVRSYYSI